MHLYRVTTLDPTGPGSLIDGLRYSGGDERWIVFHVSGTIVNTQQGFVVEKANNVRVFGNTSPQGIQITSYPLALLDCSNVELRHIAFSLQSAPTPKDTIWWDPIKVNSTDNGCSRNVRFVNCSFRGGNDEIDIGPSSLSPKVQHTSSEDVRFENCLFAYCWMKDRGPHNFNLMFTHAESAVVKNCIFSHANRRSPQVLGTAMLLGNLIYNYGSSGIALMPGVFDVRDNAFLPGPNTRTKPPLHEPLSCQPGFAGTVRAYFKGNRRLASTFKLPEGEDWKIFANQAAGDVTIEQLAEPPFRHLEDRAGWLKPSNPQQMLKLLNRAGTIFRDRWDRQVIKDIATQSGAWAESEASVGGVPKYEQGDSPLVAPTMLSEHETLDWLNNLMPKNGRDIS